MNILEAKKRNITDITNKILKGDALAVLKSLPSESVDLCITSPPYYALRDYQVKGQIGLEKTFGEYQKKFLRVIKEIKRVLKKSGQFWLNMGDIYASSGSLESRFYHGKNQGKHKLSNDNFSGRGRVNEYQSKCLLMMPERIALAMIDDGWILRNKIKWAKQVLLKKQNKTIGSVMPTSVKDRFNESGEELYFFVKNKKYYSDLDAVRLQQQTFENRPGGFIRSRELQYDSKRLKDYSPQSKQSGQRFNYRVRDAKRKAGQPQFKASEEEISKYKNIQEETMHRQGMHKQRGLGIVEKRDLPPQKEFVDKLRKYFTIKKLVAKGLKKSTVEHWFRYDESGFSYPSVEEWKKVKTKLFPELLQIRYETDAIGKYGKGSKFEEKYGEPWDRFGKKTLKARMEDTKNPKGSKAYNVKKTLSEIRTGIKRDWRKEEAEGFRMGSVDPHRAALRGGLKNLSRKGRKANNPVLNNRNFMPLKNKVKDPRGTHEGGPGSWRDFKDENPIETNIAGKNIPTIWQIQSEPHNFQKELGLDVEHFAIFPEALLEIPIKFGSPKGGLILDPFMGSGTTAIVARKLARNYIGIELSEKYIKIANKRLAQQHLL